MSDFRRMKVVFLVGGLTQPFAHCTQIGAGVKGTEAPFICGGAEYCLDAQLESDHREVVHRMCVV